MKISICIPQYNRIEYLLRSLDALQSQNYHDFEVVISDDCSIDDTQNIIKEYQSKSKYPITYYRFNINQGYDRNLRKALELASGDYCFILGNDDMLSHNNVLSELNKYLMSSKLPDIGFCNYNEYSNTKRITVRALETKIIGSGVDIGIRHYSSFSFVAGLIFKKKSFDRFNTDQFDKSIYSQIALSVNMICNGAVLFSINQVWVTKDITIGNNEKSNSYLDFINRAYKNIKPADAGLCSVINVLFSVLITNNALTSIRKNYIFSKILFSTYPYWVVDYKYNSATPAAIGLYLGLIPHKIHEFKYLNFFQKMKFSIGFQLISFISFIIPTKLFFLYKERIYKWTRKLF